MLSTKIRYDSHILAKHHNFSVPATLKPA